FRESGEICGQSGGNVHSGVLRSGVPERPFSATKPSTAGRGAGWGTGDESGPRIQGCRLSRYSVEPAVQPRRTGDLVTSRGRGRGRDGPPHRPCAGRRRRV